MSGRFRYFVILGAMRTGSNLLERYVNQFDKVTCHGELFNPGFIGKEGQDTYLGMDTRARETAPGALIEAIIANADGTIPGFRLFDGHDARIERQVLNDPSCAKIILRRDPLESYVSLLIARSTGQWLLGAGGKRRSARVRVEPEGFTTYLAELSRFHERIRMGLHRSGQAAFDLRFDDIKNPETLNGLASYLGLDQQIGTFEDSIKRQNPEPLREKIENYAEISGLLGISGVSGHQAPVLASDSHQAAETGAFFAAADHPVLYAPMPGTARGPVVTWLKGLSGAPPRRALEPGALDAWLANAPGLTSFTTTENPLARAYRVFQRRIFKGDQVYPMIQARLISNYGLSIPSGEATAEETRDAFACFMRFLKQNLAEQTGLRIDGEWDLQCRHIAAMNQLVTLTQVVSADDFPHFATTLSRKLNSPKPDVQKPGHGGGLALRQIVDEEIKTLATEIYGEDYRRLGYLMPQS